MHLVCTPLKESFLPYKVNFLIRNFNFNLQNKFRIKIYNYKENFNKINNNFLKSKNIKKNLFPEIVNILNIFHKKNFSVEYWNVLIGLWTQRNIDQIMYKFNLINSIGFFKQDHFS